MGMSYITPDKGEGPIACLPVTLDEGCFSFLPRWIPRTKVTFQTTSNNRPTSSKITFCQKWKPQSGKCPSATPQHKGCNTPLLFSVEYGKYSWITISSYASTVVLCLLLSRKVLRIQQLWGTSLHHVVSEQNCCNWWDSETYKQTW